jgi:hypothetical protein
MTLAQISMVAGVGVVCVGWCLVRAFRLGPPSVAVTYRRLYRVRLSATTEASTSGAPAWDRWLAALGERVAASTVGERFEERRRFALRSAGVTIPALAARTITAAIVGVVAALVALCGVLVAGARVPVWLLAVGPVFVGVLTGWYQLATVVARCERRHRELRGGVAAYVQLVAVCMTTRRSMNEAVAYAADVGVGLAFETIADAVHAAPQMGVRTWEALDAVGAEYGCRELEDLASSVGHVARIGVGVDTTVAAVAGRMRQVALDDMERVADRQTSTMFGPTMLFVFGVVTFLAYPLAVRVLDAFATTA